MAMDLRRAPWDLGQMLLYSLNVVEKMEKGSSFICFWIGFPCCSFEMINTEVTLCSIISQFRYTSRLNSCIIWPSNLRISLRVTKICLGQVSLYPNLRKTWTFLCWVEARFYQCRSLYLDCQLDFVFDENPLMGKLRGYLLLFSKHEFSAKARKRKKNKKMKDQILNNYCLMFGKIT